MSAKLPAVSGSSGRLIVERPPSEANIGAWPGRIFENLELPYADAMLAFVATTQERASQPASLADTAVNGSLATEKRTLDLAKRSCAMRVARSGHSGNWKMPLGKPLGSHSVPRRRPIRCAPRRRGGQPKLRVLRSGARCATNAAPPWQHVNQTMQPGGKHGWRCANAGRRCRSSAPGSLS